MYRIAYHPDRAVFSGHPFAYHPLWPVFSGTLTFLKNEPGLPLDWMDIISPFLEAFRLFLVSFGLALSLAVVLLLVAVGYYWLMLDQPERSYSFYLFKTAWLLWINYITSADPVLVEISLELDNYGSDLSGWFYHMDCLYVSWSLVWLCITLSLPCLLTCVWPLGSSRTV